MLVSWCAGISKDMAKNREVVDQFLPALKGDYLAVDKYSYREGKHVACIRITSSVILRPAWHRSAQVCFV